MNVTVTGGRRRLALCRWWVDTCPGDVSRRIARHGLRRGRQAQVVVVDRGRIVGEQVHRADGQRATAADLFGPRALVQQLVVVVEGLGVGSEIDLDAYLDPLALDQGQGAAAERPC